MIEGEVMKIALFFIVLLSSYSFASNIDEERVKRTKEAIEKAIAKEQLYAKEQVFYDSESYDFNHTEINKESLKYIKALEIDDLDMDDVYD